MKNKFEYLLLSFLLGVSVLLGLSFWLNTIYRFNLFCSAHWDEFAKLQASQTPISTGFYMSFVIAIFILLSGVYMIYRPVIKTIRLKPQKVEKTVSKPVEKTIEIKETHISAVPEPALNTDRPPRLNLPKNMAQIVQQKQNTPVVPKQNNISSQQENPYNHIISEIFSENGYVIKPNPKISGFVPNLFAIGNNEVVWIGGVDCEPDAMMAAIQKLQSVFQETLEDIPININAFILDTLNKIEKDDVLLIFKSTDELKQFISEHPADKIPEDEQNNFDSYSEYIDTIIQYIKNL